MIDQDQRPSPVQNDVTSRHAPHREEPSQLDQVDDTPAVETPVKARQGFLGKPVLIVLGASLVLAILAGIFVGYIPV